MDSKFRAKWRETRKMGVLKYTLFYGVICYGLPLGMLIAGGQYIDTYGWTLSNKIIGCIITAIIYAPIPGLLYGILTWKSSEKKWRKTSDYNY